MQIYVVQPGDSLDRIAGLYGTTIAELSYANQIPYPYQLAVGQALLVPIGEGDVDRRIVSANGYAYPFISPWVLEQTLPYLTSLFVFSYGFTTEGQLIPPDVSEDWMIAEALDFSVSPILVLTPLGADGRFNNNLIHEVLISETAMETLISNLLQTMEEKGFQGVDVDFEYILAEDRDRFTSFVAELRRRMNAAGYVVSVALAPKTSADQPGLLYEGKDYGGLGAAANEVLLMAYEWGYTYGPAMAVAPLNKVRQVIEYALTEIPSEKINLGIPNYGYDWPLPFIQGETRAQSISNQRAIELAVQYGVPIQYDETAQSPFFHYTDAGGTAHEVWFEDARSMDAKLRLIAEYGFRGAGFWNLMRPFSQVWLVLDSLYGIG